VVLVVFIIEPHTLQYKVCGPVVGSICLPDGLAD
jgi:hypothetical protein